MYNNGFCGNNCLWIIILLIIFCGCGNQGGICGANNGGNGCGHNCGCYERDNNCCC